MGRHVPSAHTQELAAEVAQPESVAVAIAIAMVIIKFLMAVLLSLSLAQYIASFVPIQRVLQYQIFTKMDLGMMYFSGTVCSC